MTDVDLVHLGRLPYRDALKVQLDRQSGVIAGRSRSTLFLVEHEPILTLGAGFHRENLLLDPAEYSLRGIDVIESGRGGDVTFHGPGQLVAYPVFDLNVFGRDLHAWLRSLEEVFLQAVASFEISARRFAPHTGVWVGDDKIAAIGIKVSRWVSIHGVALNCDADLSPFDTIVPCGIQHYGVTSLSRATGTQITVESATKPVLASFESVLGVRFHS